METETIEILPRTRHCFVPGCSNNSNKNRNMVFVPVKNELKEDWCLILNRNCPNRRLYCCETHLDLENDLQNYDKWKQQGGYPIMSKNATLKRIAQIHSEQTGCNSATSDLLMNNISVENCDKIIQVKPCMDDKCTFIKQTLSSTPKLGKKRKYEDIKDSSTPVVSCSEYENELLDTSTSGKTTKTYPGRQFLLNLVYENPLMYIGIPKTSIWIIDHIAKENKTDSLNIIVTLFKIRQGDTLVRLSQQFQISKNRMPVIFYETTTLLSSFFQNFIIAPSKFNSKINLPYAFKINYSNVWMIIDCFEIGIEKPSNPARQAQTWSAYKSCNTVKYLVGATPGGLITFISKGYGGRISDKAITLQSGVIDYIPTNAVIMADRGFKEIESLLSVKNIKLLRPPSVYSHDKPSKAQVIESKVVASLRIHIERVIRRLREFRILKPHSVINNKHVAFLNEYVIIACGLCNLQSSIIKNQ